MSNKKPVITVDFDETLAASFGVSDGIREAHNEVKPITRVCNWVIEKAKEGFEIHIITFRRYSQLAEVYEFIEKWKLPIETVIATGQTSKTPHMLGLNSTLHVDDMVEVLVDAQLKGIKGLLVDQPYNQVEFNSTAAYFDRI